MKSKIHPSRRLSPPKKAILGMAVLGASTILTPLQAAAQSTTPEAIKTAIEGREIESDGIDRIAHANLLPMLTQRVAAASCSLTSDVDVEEAREVLDDANHQFETIVLALRDGNPDLHIIGAETRRTIVHDIEEVWTEWAPVHDAIEAVLKDGHDVESAHVIDDHNLALYELTSVLTSDISAHYSDPYVLSQSDAFIFGLMARQRTLTQQMAKDACEIWTGYHSEEAKADLDSVMTIFERSLYALRDGLPEMGVPAAPTDLIRADLDDLIGRWDVLKGNLLKLVAGEELDEAGKYEIFHDFNVELAHINLLVTHYRDFSERHH